MSLFGTYTEPYFALFNELHLFNAILYVFELATRRRMYVFLSHQII